MSPQNTRPTPTDSCTASTDTSYLEKGALYSQLLHLYRSVRNELNCRGNGSSQRVRLRLEIYFARPKTVEPRSKKGAGSKLSKYQASQSISITAEHPEKQRLSDREDSLPFFELNLKSQKALVRAFKLLPSLGRHLDKKQKEQLKLFPSWTKAVIAMFLVSAWNLLSEASIATEMIIS